MLSEHPHLAWLPGRISATFPERLELSRLFMKGLDYPVVGELLKRSIKPAESYPFWEHHCKGFSAPYRDLVAADVTDKTKKHIPRTMARILTEKRNRLLLKITGWPRIGFLSEVFEDARFIHVMRDGRAVANSMLNVYFWQGWKGPHNWGWGELSPAQKKEWDEHDQSFVVLAAIQWKILMDAMEKAKNTIGKERLLEIRRLRARGTYGGPAAGPDGGAGRRAAPRGDGRGRGARRARRRRRGATRTPPPPPRPARH